MVNAEEIKILSGLPGEQVISVVALPDRPLANRNGRLAISKAGGEEKCRLLLTTDSALSG